jgi:hypothetical protein
MDRDYDIFECFEDGSIKWLDHVSGHDAAVARARTFAANSTNELRVIHLPTKSVVAVLNARKSPGESAPDKPEGNNGGTGELHSALWRFPADFVVRVQWCRKEFSLGRPYATLPHDYRRRTIRRQRHRIHIARG